MKYEKVGSQELEYYPCRYGDSKILFRGPRKDLSKPYVAFLGGSETYGKFVETPFPEVLAQERDLNCVNLGCMNAGIDVFLQDPAIVEMCKGAQATVIQVMGAQNMSNRFYSVHPRRNDRFTKASTLMQTIFSGVDFTDFNFTRHMLGTLWRLAPERFDVLRDELRTAWVARMKLLAKRVGPGTVLLWVAQEAPLEGPLGPEQDPLEHDPLFVDRGMIEEIRPHVDAVVEALPSASARKEGSRGMQFNPEDAAAAEVLVGVRHHVDVAVALEGALRDVLK